VSRHRRNTSGGSTGSQSWISGTMGVISGLAPRPSTPQRSVPVARSAPNSPARNGGRVPSHDYPGIQRVPSYDYPGISRVPSADAMERSLHNESGHGKSTAQLIRDLKASNASFSARQAEMEAEFMNEINRVTRSFEEKNRSLEASLKEKTSHVTSLEARCTSSELRIREQNAQVVKLKDDNAFLRHTISDLKSQLMELKDAEYDKRDDWGMEKEEMTLELENLRTQVETLKRGLEGSGHSSEALESFKQLEDSQHALKESTKKLHETRSALATMETSSKRSIQEHSQELARLKKKHADMQAEWSRSEMELQNKIERLEGDENPVIKELNAQLQECDTTIASLREEVENSTAQVTELQAELQKTKSEATSREAYRREEAEDLRVMLDAQAEEIEHLKEDLDECQREIFTKEDDLVAAEKELDDQIDRYAELKAEMEAMKKGGGSVVVAAEGNDRVHQLERELADALETIQKLESEIDEINEKHQSVVDSLQAEIDDLIADRDDVESRLATVEEERDQAREELAISNSMVDRNVVSPSKDPKDTIRSQSLEFAELEQKTAAMEAEASANKKRAEEIQAELDAANEKLRKLTQANEEGAKARSNDAQEVENLRLKVKELEIKAAEVEKAKKQLLDAQIALVALDNDRKKIADAYREKTEQVEKQREELESKTAASQEATSRTKELEGELERLKKQFTEKNVEVETITARAVPEVNGTSNEKEVEALNEEISKLKESESELKSALEALEKAKAEQEHAMKEKLLDRDTTISALVKSSVTNDQKLRALRTELKSLKSGQGADEVSVSSASRTSRDVSLLNNANEIEKKMKAELDSYKKNLFEAELESQRLRDELEEAKSFGGTGRGNLKKQMDAMVLDHQEKIQERDAAIATLVKQSMSQEAHVASLEQKIASLKSELLTLSPNKNHGPSYEEMDRLRKESEIFAGQIIEQDEEMEALKNELDERDREIASLKNQLKTHEEQLSTNRADAKEVVRLRAELDELQESNRTHLMELRDLRRKLRDTKFDSNKMADLEIELSQTKRALEEQKTRSVVTERVDPKLKQELADARRARERAEKTIAEQLETIRLSQATADALEKQLKDREATIADLKSEFSKSKNDALLALQSEVDRLRVELQDQTAQTVRALADLEDMKRSRNNAESSRDGALEALESEVEVLRSQLRTLEDERAHIEELKDRLARAEEDRESVEQSIVDSYERKMNLLKLDKDVTIDQLRKDLAEAKGKNVHDLDGLMNRIHQLEMENKGLSNELDAEIEAKNAQVYALEQTLQAQERLVDNMRAEMDQLQSGMEQTTESRRAEIDDMEQEMLESTAKTTRQEREITALKIELEETKLQQEAKVAKLLDKIAAMEASPLARSVAEQHVDHRLEEVKERLEQMKWSYTSLEQDNAKLRSRLEKAEAASRSIDEDLDQMECMEEEIGFLQSRVKELEKERDDAQAAAQEALRAVPRAKDLARAPPPPPKAQSHTSQETRRSQVQSESPARRHSSHSRLRFPKFRSNRNSKEFSNEEAPPIPGDE
jgi:chromosome segregation ATPase